MFDPSSHPAAEPRQPQPAGPLQLPVTAAGISARAAAREAEARARGMAAALELMTSLDGADSLEAAGERLALGLATVLGAARVLVVWRRANQSGMQIVADRARDGRPDNASESQTRLIVAAAEEIAARGGLALWPPVSHHHRHALLAVGQLARAWSAEAIAAIDLPVASGRSGGAVLVVDSQSAESASFLRVIAETAGSRLTAIDRLTPSRWERSLRAAIQAVRSPRRHHTLGAFLLIVLVMVLPLRYRVRTDLEIQPVQHRFVAVPFDGPLQTAHVRPGDVVQQGDPLATINPREIEYELAGVRAELEQAIQEQKSKLAQHDSAGSQIAALESDRLRMESELLQYRRENLQIRSPISGVVVSGDWKQNEGIPMNRGEVIFEIAPLGRVVVEIAVPESDLSHVRPGMPVWFYVHALPHRVLSGHIDRLHPRATLVDHENVFIAEMQLDDPDNLLRPGMRGRATVVSDRHPLAWNLLHKPYYAVRQLAGW